MSVENRYYPMYCPNCQWKGMSNDTNGGEPIADTGDYHDLRCPKCDSLKVDEDNPPSYDEINGESQKTEFVVMAYVDCGGPCWERYGSLQEEEGLAEVSYDTKVEVALAGPSYCRYTKHLGPRILVKVETTTKYTVVKRLPDNIPYKAEG